MEEKMKFECELQAGLRAVTSAVKITKKIQNQLCNKDSITKTDKSPVTVADYAAQAVICHRLNQELNQPVIVGEENSDELKKETNQELVEKIVTFIQEEKSIEPKMDKGKILESIDLGRGAPEGRFWTLDPVDGTKGFLRKEQYAIALALIDQGQIQLGLLGCPNFQVEGQESSLGYIFYAIQGQGSWMLNLQTNKKEKIHISGQTSPAAMRFCQSYESAHGNMDLQELVAKKIGIQTTPIRMDSQVKYAAVALGQAHVYLRIPNPKNPDYREKIWDHAAGAILVAESGGKVTDMFGNLLDFSQGITLNRNRGVLVAVPQIHSIIQQVIQQQNLSL
jgi:3'(2'), 5'-bisphosphate nucleotidase